MKAIILSAGQGKRLSPYTEHTPKCLLNLGGGISLLGWQLAQLLETGIDDIVVVTGFKADKVEREIADFIATRHQSSDPAFSIRAIHNPDYANSDNLRSVWCARDEMTEDFILLNGDTLFRAPVARSLMARPDQPITLTTSRKDRYDTDDMKVILHENLLRHIGKTLDVKAVDAESIGMIRFMKSGVSLFREAVERIIESGEGDRLWYLSVIDRLAHTQAIHIADVPSQDWCEVDFPVDLQKARTAISLWNRADLDHSRMEAFAAKAS
ncbi:MULTISPECIES: phosphocholine cytidylyltransferase family protein [unclassified Iodidimonas]|uniref:phosphocholine cytidylyltransferase family protein n=1 Tax=unclassified Iodidimonas TaxID=2626145 RepID=UPI0024831422|nr:MULTISPECIES: phosphocholine cytidylyltransferase family protein [unclassified Iodidimonas]